MQTAILTACANPIRGDGVQPLYRCDLIEKTVVAGQPDTYRFTSKATARDGATLENVTYDFGDGSAAVTVTDPSAAVTYAYTKPGNYTARMTANFKVPGDYRLANTAETCATPVTVASSGTPNPPRWPWCRAWHTICSCSAATGSLPPGADFPSGAGCAINGTSNGPVV